MNREWRILHYCRIFLEQSLRIGRILYYCRITPVPWLNFVDYPTIYKRGTDSAGLIYLKTAPCSKLSGSGDLIDYQNELNKFFRHE